MAITNLDTMINAMANNSQGFNFVKPFMHSLSVVAGQIYSYWLSVGNPPAGDIPGAAAICTNNLKGGFPILNPTGGNELYLTRMFALASIIGCDIQLHDRLAHMGGLDANITTSQTVNVNVSGAGNNMVLRKGAADYSEVQWWLEFYVTTGGVSPNVTVTYTNGAGTSGRTVVLTGIGTTIRVGRAMPIIGSGGEAIQSIQSIQLSVGSGAVGNFGVTATRLVSAVHAPLANNGATLDFLQTNLTRVHDDSCLALILVVGATPLGNAFGSFRLAQG